MGTEQIMYCIVALIFGMLIFHMLKSVCGCNNVEGLSSQTPAPAPPPPLPACCNADPPNCTTVVGGDSCVCLGDICSDIGGSNQEICCPYGDGLKPICSPPDKSQGNVKKYYTCQIPDIPPNPSPLPWGPPTPAPTPAPTPPPPPKPTPPPTPPPPPDCLGIPLDRDCKSINPCGVNQYYSRSNTDKAVQCSSSDPNTNCDPNVYNKVCTPPAPAPEPRRCDTVSCDFDEDCEKVNCGGECSFGKCKLTADP